MFFRNVLVFCYWLTGFALFVVFLMLFSYAFILVGFGLAIWFLLLIAYGELYGLNLVCIGGYVGRLGTFAEGSEIVCVEKC